MLRIFPCLIFCLNISFADNFGYKNEVIFNDPKISVIDATVIKIDNQGHVHLKIHELIHGVNKPKVLKEVALACVSSSPKMYGVQSRKRYIFLTYGENMFEERSYHSVFLDKGEVFFYYTIRENGKYLDTKRFTIKELKEYISQFLKEDKRSMEESVFGSED